MYIKYNLYLCGCREPNNINNISFYQLIYVDSLLFSHCVG